MSITSQLNASIQPIAEHPVIGRFRQIAPIDNPSTGEDLIREFIKQTLDSLGILDQSIDAAGNLFARVPGQLQQPVIMLSAHMDSVPPCCGIEPVDDFEGRSGRPIIRSAGKTILGADDKSGIAVILELVHQFFSQAFLYNRPLELLFSTEEEIGLNGAKGFDMAKSQAEYCYVLDGEGRVGMIFNAGPSQENIQITVTGKAAHAGIEPEMGVNAIQIAAEMISRLPVGRLAPDLTSNLGVIDGGRADNVIAPNALIKGEARSHDEEKLADLLAQFRQTGIEVIAQYQHQPHPVHIDVKTSRRYDRFFVPQEHRAITRASQAAVDLGIIPLIAAMNIGSDAHILNKNGLVTVVLGMGFHFSHSLGEFIYCEELAQVYQMVYLLCTT